MADPAALLRPGLELELIRLPADVGRPFAVAVHRRGMLIGYLPRPDARLVAKLIDRGGSARAFVLALHRQRSLSGTRLKDIVIEIEAGSADGSPLPQADLAEIAARSASLPVGARRSILARSPVAGSLYAGALVALGIWAVMPAVTGELDGGRIVRALTAEVPSGGEGALPEPTLARVTGFELPQTVEAPLDLPPELSPHAALALSTESMGTITERAAAPFAGLRPAPVIPAWASGAASAPRAVPVREKLVAAVPLPPRRPDDLPTKKR
ncbi:HIRAN domain-containing protein [Bosea sp. 117]|uniref:HIRAN domain-containing protein n=1 Tax=Bosea sp. 117 TaxID=1125973 RepID=UPI0012DDB2AE|nr:HIRAN domain-containing protein [Bosea sp. 117]